MGREHDKAMCTEICPDVTKEREIHGDTKPREHVIQLPAEERYCPISKWLLD